MHRVRSRAVLGAWRSLYQLRCGSVRSSGGVDTVRRLRRGADVDCGGRSVRRLHTRKLHELPEADQLLSVHGGKLCGRGRGAAVRRVSRRKVLLVQPSARVDEMATRWQFGLARLRRLRRLLTRLAPRVGYLKRRRSVPVQRLPGRAGGRAFGSLCLSALPSGAVQGCQSARDGRIVRVHALWWLLRYHRRVAWQQILRY